MSIKTKIKHHGKDRFDILAYDERTPKDKSVVFSVDKNKKEIIFTPRENKYTLNKIILEGFSSIPDCFNEKGYIKAGCLYYLDKMLKDKKVIRLIISKDKNNSFKKYFSGHKVVINYKALLDFKNQLSRIISESKIDKSNTANDFFYELFPLQFEKSIITPRQRVNKVIKNLDHSIIEYLESKDVDIILDFLEALLKTKYKSRIKKRKLFSKVKIKVDDITITEIIDQFKNYLIQNKSEKEWGTFLDKNLFLLDSKYIKSIPELNVVLAGARKVDFGLIDSQGYLDIFEIKKPTTKLLAKQKDRGNYYWNTETVKALVQAEKYLYNAESKRSMMQDDIEREKGIKVKIIKPRAVVILGNSKQLDNNSKKEDFRVLRMALKNVEVILYDELLDRIKNQKNKIFNG